jgi:hypothetical protein
VALFAGWWLAGAAARVIVGAQRPERPQAVAIPGVDSVSLKAGWQLLFYGGCRFAVPGSWHPDADSSIAVAPDGSNVSVRMFRITNWSSHKARIKEAFGRISVVHEDSERRLWFEIGNAPRLQHYVDVATGLDVCSGLLEVHGAMTSEVEDMARTIAQSVGPAPDR